MSPETPSHSTPSGQPRARAIGIPFDGDPGELNAITDVPSVEVGFTTLIEGDDVRTGVTAILPRGRSDPGDPCAAGFHSLNGNGEMTGVSWVEESGTVSLPITLTNTHSVGTAHEATIRWVVDRFPEIARAWLLPVAAETWDGYLNDINGLHVSAAHVIEAISCARPGAVEEGSVGGGTGMNCYGFKGGTGTASRVVAIGSNTYRVGVLLQCNFGSRHELTIAGVPMGAALAADNPLEDEDWFTAGSGSVIGIVVTDAPLLPGQCKALARRVPLGTGSDGNDRLAFLGRSVPRAVNGQSWRVRHGASDRRSRRSRGQEPRVRGLEVDGRDLRGRRSGDRGGGDQRPGRESGDGRARRSPDSRTSS